MSAGSFPTWLAGPATRLLADHRLILAALALLLPACIGLRLAQTINNDVAWHLYSAQKLLEGGRFYRDIFFEVNPPLIAYLNVPAAFLARLTDSFAVPVYLLYVFALIGLSITVSWRVLAMLPGAAAAERRALLCAAFGALVILPAGDFGQREHLMVTLALPYLLLVVLRACGGGCARPLAAVVGALGALGFCIKPHFLAVPLAVEVYLLCRHRSLRGLLRGETLALAATGMLYAVALVILTPEYLTHVVPYALELYNGAIRNDLPFVLRRVETILVPAALLLYPFLRPRLASAEASDLFLIAASCLFAVYLAQMKGWNYQIYPTTAMLFLFLVASLTALLRADTAAPAQSARRAGLAPLAVAALIASLLVKPLFNPGNHNNLADRLLPIVRQHAAGSSIYAFSSNTWVGFPLVLYAEVEWSSRFPHLWPLPGLELRRRSAGAGSDPQSEAILEEIERFTLDAVIADLKAQPPALIVVDARADKSWYTAPFDFIDYFSRDPRFVEFWAYYEKIDDVFGFQVYRRCTTPCPS